MLPALAAATVRDSWKATHYRAKAFAEKPRFAQTLPRGVNELEAIINQLLKP
jgi:hypothetical protein